MHGSSVEIDAQVQHRARKPTNAGVPRATRTLAHVSSRGFASIALAVVVACAPLPRTFYSAQDEEIAQVPGYEGIRAWADGTPEEYRAQGLSTPKIAGGGSYLALSGGGSAGAYGAGVLVGWTKSGTRPQFQVVSGVSIGALIAPFAFLGTNYDASLAAVFTTGVAKDAAERKWLPVALLGDSLLKPDTLYRLVESFATPQLIADIATQYRKGRRLYVVTTNIDAQRAVIWDIGKIAASGRPDSLMLFRKVLIASASIPAGYPPVLINVAAAGRTFQEMHTDGGTWTQVFTLPEGLLTIANSGIPSGSSRWSLYVIVNNTLAPEFALTTDSTIPLLARAYSTIIKSQTRASLVATYEFTKRIGADFHVAAIDRVVPPNPKNSFDTAYMRALFQLGFDQASAGTVWKSAPTFDASKALEPPLAAPAP
jgi:hypothetical protein